MILLLHTLHTLQVLLFRYLVGMTLLYTLVQHSMCVAALSIQYCCAFLTWIVLIVHGIAIDLGTLFHTFC